MPSPLDHVDAASFFGSWPLTPYFSGTTPAVLPGALLDRATLLGARRESDAGFTVSGRSFKIWIDAVGPLTVTFTGTNPLDLDSVITQINSGVLGGYGQDVAFRDNGFLRLRSATIGGTSYLKIDTDPASSPADVFFELGLYAGLESYGGRLTSSPTVDPDRQVALPGQYSVGFGEDLDYNAINRAMCQLAVNADHAYGQFRRGMAKTTSKDLAISSDEVQITGENVYCGKITGGSAQDDTATVLGTDDNEVVIERDTDTHTSLALDFYYNVEEQKQYVEATAATPFAAGDAAGDYYVVVTPGGSFGALEKMKIIEFVSTSIVVVANIVEADGSEVEVGTPSSPVSTSTGIRRRTDTERLYITDFLDGPGGTSVIDTAVEIVAATTISRIEWNNRLVCDSATFSANGVKEGDVAVIASHDTSVPFSNNGSYRVSKVIDEKTIELMGLDHGPILLNSLGVLGTVTIQTDTNFFYQPYAKLNFAPPSGTYRVIFKKYSSLLEMVDDVDAFATSPTRFTQEASTDLQKVVKAIIGPSATTFNEYLYDDKRSSLENLYFRLNQEHNADGHHPYLYITDTMPGSTLVGKKLAIQYDADPVVTGDSAAGFSTNVRSLTADVSGVSAVNVAAENNDTVGTYKPSWIGAIWGEVGITDAGLATTGDVFSGYVHVDNAAGEFTGAATVFRAYPPSITGTVGELYGMRIDAVTGGTTNYGLRIIGADPGYALRVDSGFTWLQDPVAIDNATANDDYSLNVVRYPRATGSVEYAGVFVYIMDDPPVSSFPGALWVINDCNLGTGESHGQLRGILNDLDKDGDGDLDSWYSFRTNFSVNGGTVGSINAYYTGGAITSGAVTNVYGFHYDEPSVSGTLAAQYGVDISPMSLATNNFGVRIRGASPGYSLYVDSGYTRLIGPVAMDEAAPDDDVSLYIKRTASGATTQNDVYSYLDVNAAATGTMSNIFLYSRDSNASGTVNNLRGVQSNMYKTGAGDLSNAYGFRNYVTMGGGGTIASLVGFSQGGNVNTPCTVTSAVSFQAENLTTTGTLTTQYGLKVVDLTSGVTNYGVYIEGASPGYAILVDSGNVRFEDGKTMVLNPGTVTPTANAYAFEVLYDFFSPSAGHKAASIGSSCSATPNNHNNTGLISYANANFTSGTGKYYCGMYAGAYFGAGSAGTITHAQAFAGDCSLNAGSTGTIANAYVFYAWDGGVGGGSIDNYYGLYVYDLQGATNCYGVYVDGAKTDAIKVADGRVTFDGTDNPNTTIGQADYQWSYRGLGVAHRMTNATGNTYAHVFVAEIDAAAGSYNYNNVNHGIAIKGTANASFISALWAQVDNKGTGTVDNVAVYEGGCYNGSTGEITGAMVYGAYNGSAGSGTIGTYYGMWIENITCATTNYGLYLAGASTAALYAASGDSYFVDSATLAGTEFASSWYPKLGVESQPGTVSGPNCAIAGLLNIAGFTGSNNQVAICASVDLLASANANGPNRASGIYSQVFTHHSTGCNIIHAHALETWVGNYGTGSITNAYGLYVWENSKNSGTMTNSYGIYIENQRDGATNYGLRIIGASPGYALYIDSGVTYFGNGDGLHLDGNSGNSITFYELGAERWSIRQNATNELHFDWINSSKMVLDGNSGKYYLGIGTEDPARRLHVLDTAYQMRLAYNVDSYVDIGPGNTSWCHFLANTLTWGFYFNHRITSTTGQFSSYTGVDLTLEAPNGSARVTIEHDTGNVGINTSNPTHTLQVNGVANVTELETGILDTSTNAAGPNRMLMQAQASTDKFIRFRRGGSPSGNAGVCFSAFDVDHYFVYAESDGDLLFRYSTENSTNPDADSATEKMRLTTDGKLGIGMDPADTYTSAMLSAESAALGGTAGNEQELVALHATSAQQDYLQTKIIRHTTGATWETANWIIQRRVDTTLMGYIRFGSHTNDTITFGEGSTERMRIDGSGNVAIGNSTASAKFHVKGNSSVMAIEGTDHCFISFYPTLVAGGRKAYFGFGSASTEVLTISNEYSGTVGTRTEIWINSGRRFSVDGNGNASIGGGTPLVGTRLDVSGDLRLGAADATMRIQAGTTGTNGAIHWTFNGGTNYGEIDLDYDLRATQGLRIKSAFYPITYDGVTNHLWKISSNERLLLDNTKLAPYTAAGLSLGGTSNEFSNGYINTVYTDEPDDHRAQNAKTIRVKVSAAAFASSGGGTIGTYDVTTDALTMPPTSEAYHAPLPAPINANGTFTIGRVEARVDVVVGGQLTITLYKVSTTDGITTGTSVATWTVNGITTNWTPLTTNLAQTFESNHSYVLEVENTSGGAAKFGGMFFDISANAIPVLHHT